ncbi:MAG: diaminohydroxyphosphoribosylaminopyrimidine deaminase [Gammaproteobacteria bacterium]|jgi:diaminohydroxyphosphoribosylaminopyrimidine deaminase/5-amino-6-(5-phosphoribosylamino)uracil reductase
MAELAQGEANSAPFTEQDRHWMRRAIELAERGLYSTAPNPRVGCVLVREGQIIGEGWHRAAGQAHAEIEALNAAKNEVTGATVYVTMEPCSHHGRTAPCADALIKAGVTRIIAATADPSEKVSGRGFARLERAGIGCRVGLEASAAEALNPGFTSIAVRKRPWLRLKLAASIDGRTAMANGESQWITGSPARADVQHWRARSSAILTGAGTVLRDQPRLCVREEELTPEHRSRHSEAVRQPARIIVTTRGGVTPNAQMLERGGPILLMGAGAAKTDDTQSENLPRHPLKDPARGVSETRVEVEHVPLNCGPAGVDLREVLAELAAREYHEVLAECGATLAGSLLSAGLVDELLLYLAPCALGDSARPLAHLPGLEHMQDRLRFTLNDVRQFGNDVRLQLTPVLHSN